MMVGEVGYDGVNGPVRGTLMSMEVKDDLPLDRLRERQLSTSSLTDCNLEK